MKGRPTGPAFFSRHANAILRPPAYEPRRPDFIDVAGGFPALTGGAGGGAGGCSLVGSITEGGGAPFLFFEKSGISFFRFIVVSVQKGRF